MTVVLEREIGAQTVTEGRPCEDTERRWPCKGQGERLRRNQPCQHFDLEHLASRIGRK